MQCKGKLAPLLSFEERPEAQKNTGRGKSNKLPILQIRMSKHRLKKTSIILNKNITNLNDHALILQSSVSRNAHADVPFTTQRNKTLKNQDSGAQRDESSGGGVLRDEDSGGVSIQKGNGAVLRDESSGGVLINKGNGSVQIHKGNDFFLRDMRSPILKKRNQLIKQRQKKPVHGIEPSNRRHRQKDSELLEKQLSINSHKMEDLNECPQMESYSSKSLEDKMAGRYSIEQQIRSYNTNRITDLLNESQKQLLKEHGRTTFKKTNLSVYRGHHHKNDSRWREKEFARVTQAPPSIYQIQIEKQVEQNQSVMGILQYFSQKATLYRRQYLSLEAPKRSNLIKEIQRRQNRKKKSTKTERKNLSHQQGVQSRPKDAGKLKNERQYLDPWEVVQASCELLPFESEQAKPKKIKVEQSKGAH